MTNMEDSSLDFDKDNISNEEDMIFPDQDSTNFPISVKNNLAKISKQFSKKEFLKYHQYIVYNYVIKNPKSRGLLLFHEMGMGKSISAVALSEFYRKHDPQRKIIVLLPKSLQSNFQQNVEKLITNTMKQTSKDLTNLDDKNLDDKNLDDIIKKKYKFVSLNASNMFTQMTRVGKTTEELIAEKQLSEFVEMAQSEDFLENSLLIIDEFHNLANSITNGSSNAIRLYDMIMKTKNIKLLFLTGTPIINKPFELVPTFNMLRGPVKVDDRTNVTLFPELQKDFDMYFIDHKNNTIKNMDRFQNRIFGMCSYYGSLYFGDKHDPNFPTEYPIKVVKVPMSSDQFSRYDAARDLEREESSVKGRPSRSERFSTKGSVSSSYRVKSRQISNYLIPEYALGPPRGNKARVKHIHKITKTDLQKLDTFSPKFKHILENINKHKNQLGLVYSEFVSGEGLGIFAQVLETYGYTSWQKTAKGKEDTDSFDLKLGGQTKETKSKETKQRKYYAIISGDISIDEREKIVQVFNQSNNMHGEHIALLLISKTGAEGLDLKGVRHIHICEPYWNYARLEQIIARGVRYASHVGFPKSEQNVQPYIYLSDYPTSYSKKKKEDTTDVDLYKTAKQNKFLINQFLVNMVSASIDCTTHEHNFDKKVKSQIKCKLCSPNDKSLYHPILSKDMSLPNPCEELKQTTIQAKEIDVDGEKYYYSTSSEKKDTFDIFKYDKSINGYVPLQQHERNYSAILRKLLKLDN